MNFSCMYVEHCMTSQLTDCKVPKTQLEAEGLLSNMKQLDFECWSPLLNRFSAISSALGLHSPRLNFNDAIPMQSSMADFCQSQRDLFDECKKHGQVKS